MVIVRGAVSPDHIHLLLSAPSILSPAKLARYIKAYFESQKWDEDDRRFMMPHNVARGIVTRISAARSRLQQNPVIRTTVQQAASNFVEFPPLGCPTTKAAMALVPTLMGRDDIASSSERRFRRDHNHETWN